jgi:hypothetical protein
MRAFEEKCRRLYETRLTDYIERTDQQLSEYEGQLLQVSFSKVYGVRYIHRLISLYVRLVAILPWREHDLKAAYAA